jgi:uncharacterized protein
VKTNVGIDKEEAIDFIEKAIIKSNNESSEQISLAIKDSYKRFWNLPFLMKHCRKLKKKQIKKRLRSFLKTWAAAIGSAFGRKRILAIDPGYRSGCKVVCLDEKEICFIMKPFTLTLPKMKAEWR